MTARALLLTACVALVAGARHARAESTDQPAQLVVALPLFALSSNAIAVQVERPVARRLSVAVSLGARDGADGDYQALGLGFGAELRVWLRPKQRGWFAGVRAETQIVRMSERSSDRMLGTGVLIDEGLVGGYRFVLGGRVELTPTLGLALRHDLGHGAIPGTTKGTPWYGLSAGWLFR